MRESKVLTCQKSIKVIVDLKGVTFMDAAGWAILIHVAEEILKTQGKAVILNMTPAVESVYKLLEPKHLPSFSTEADALHYLG